MTLMEVNLDDPIELREFAASSIVEASEHSEMVATGIQNARSKAREVAGRAIDVFFLDPLDFASGNEKNSALLEYEQFLKWLEAEAREYSSKFYDLRLEMDQGLGFLLLNTSRDNSMTAGDVEDLVQLVTSARDGHTSAIAITDSLMDAIKVSAGAISGLEGAAADAVVALKDVRDELDIGQAVLTRHISMATHLRNFIIHGQKQFQANLD